ncbi:vacuolar protein sorting-associated protein 51, fragment, putative [Plasmodium knowlesi strain H]|uniref:Vacuolar protein sorting-associated protein 51 homolog n=2 Tax=Plasmodium knowlesi TaxID=5850 RepID=A0A679KRT3_PLAKH|nr:vacuolar protein sorting-associated protein 51, fragment, putative [Plasmodium knowlesi strain H]OTN68534.1 putative Vacuolar protein sorting-associated protein 51 [Plasmodium knowlesi]CAA9986560.1 vacuolar protein sorting-associated protein 51, fragment, putative [Plasmodium knowlesi strain H]VVS76034.1 vacuolar protein sorting-associated protein 51, fragment, putative [Plasmodium knowlesi strain H]
MFSDVLEFTFCIICTWMFISLYLRRPCSNLDVSTRGEILHLEKKKIILVIIKILFKNYSEYVRDLHFNEYGFEKLRVNFFFFFHCLKIFVPMDDEHVLFVILNEVLISAYERSMNFTLSNAGVNALYQAYLLSEIDCDIEANRKFIMNSLRRV